MVSGKKNISTYCFNAIFRIFLVGMCLVFLSACVTSGGSRGGASGGRSAGSNRQPAGINPHYKIGNPYSIAGRLYYPAADEDYAEIGVASWYGPNFHNKPTANGELFDMNALTAAHRTLPLPSIVEVTHLGNGRKIRLRVNDRGPFSKDRIIDLSREAAERLGMRESGTARVKVEYLREASLELALTRVNDRKGIRAIENSLKNSNRRNVRRNARKSNPRKSNLRQSNARQQQRAPSNDDLTALITQTTSAPQEVNQGLNQERQFAPIPNYGALPIIETASSALPSRGGSVNREKVSLEYQIQVGAFLDPNRAERLSLLLNPSGPVFIQSELRAAGSARKGQNFYKVFMGPFHDQTQARSTLNALHNAGYGEARLIETGSW